MAFEPDILITVPDGRVMVIEAKVAMNDLPRIDSDLQPWGQKRALKDDLRKLFDDANLRVYGDFTLQFPPRPADFE
jgi:DNA anti-recombination protein RmuC